MRVSPVVLCCWPGLLRLWRQGDGLALAMAILFGGAFNLLLVFSCREVVQVSPAIRGFAWLLLGGLWLCCAVRSYRALGVVSRSTPVDDRGLFIQAQGEYLRGHWFEAESILNKVLQTRRDDVDAQLLLAALYRHTRRFDEAQARLELMQQFDGAEKWRWEIAAERRLLRRLSDSAEIE